MKKEFFSVEIEGAEKPLLFADKTKAAEFGKPKTHKVEASTFNAMLQNGDFEDAVQFAKEVIEEETPKEESTNLPITEQQEEFRAMLEQLKAQIEKLQQENARLKIRPSFADLVLIHERKETVLKHMSRFIEGKVKLEHIKKELHGYNELDESEYITLSFFKTNRQTAEITEMCRISNVTTLNALTSEALKQIDDRMAKLEEEKEMLESNL